MITNSVSARMRISSSIAIGIFLLVTSQAAMAQWSSNGNDVYKTNTVGNVGIGTSSPADPLHVVYPFGKSDTTPRDGFEISSNDSSNRFKLYFKAKGGTSLNDRYFWLQTGDYNVADGGNLLLQPNAGNVGLGTLSPAAKLDIGGKLGVDTSGAGYLLIANTTAPTSFAGANYDRMLMGFISNTAVIKTDNAGSGTLRPIQLTTGGNAGLYLNTSGQVGIGTTTPAEALDVAGNIKASGTIFAKYQDVAEWVPSSERLTSGTVVVLDPTKSNQVIASSIAYDTRVAGVISSQPGITLGEKSEDKVLVATTGRVRVMVDATKAPINIGDLLVTSDIPGVAMKSEAVSLGGVSIHRPGTIIGKALEPLTKGKGEILVLLSLQ